MNELALFAGAGGGILGGHLLGWRTVCAVEQNEYARDVLLARQDDGVLPTFPVWDDVRTFDGEPWRGCVDVVSGGFPCQDISAAGKGAGIEGERSGLWSHMARVVREVRPRFVFVENSPVLTSRGLGRVLGDLASLGFDAAWCVLGADDAGAPHRRKRIWIVALGASGEQPCSRVGNEPPNERASRRNAPPGRGSPLADANGGRCDGLRLAQPGGLEGTRGSEPDGRCHPRRFGQGRVPVWPPEPDVGRVVFDGVAARVDRLRAIGNGQVPRVAAAAFELLCARGGW